jgi:hypothetical protein
MAPEADLDDPEVQRGFQEGLSVPTIRCTNCGVSACVRDAPDWLRKLTCHCCQGLNDPTTLPQDSRDLSRKMALP